jgi:hypothetical protein
MKTSKLKYTKHVLLLLFAMTMINTVYAHGDQAKQVEQANELKRLKVTPSLAAFDIVHAKIVSQ